MPKNYNLQLCVDFFFIKLYNFNMETTEFDLMISKDQISFDFENLEEESSLPSPLLKALNHDYIANEVLFVVAKVKGENICPNFSELKLSGKTMLEWTCMAGNECEQKIIEEGEEIARLKQIVTDKPIIALFYSDTPLFDKKSFHEIIDYFSQRGMNYLRLNRGLVIKTSYLERVSGNLVGDVAYESKTLLAVDDAKKINFVNSILQERILSYHIHNGVVFLGDNVYIEADCEIEKGTIIYPSNTILGQSVIEGGAVIESGNVINDSIICKGVCLKGCYIEKSKVTSSPSPLSKIINQKV